MVSSIGAELLLPILRTVDAVNMAMSFEVQQSMKADHLDPFEAQQSEMILISCSPLVSEDAAGNVQPAAAQPENMGHLRKQKSQIPVNQARHIIHHSGDTSPEQNKQQLTRLRNSPYRLPSHDATMLFGTCFYDM
jgi:hypothetical protein